MNFQKLALSSLLGLMLAITGCGDDGGTTPVPDGGTPDATPDGAADAPPAACDGTGPTGFFVINQLDVGREDPPGTAPGFNLDGLVSDDTDPAGCFQPDFLGLDGTPGVDNQFAVLAPTLESALGSDLGETIQDSITAGDILILVELETGSDMCTDLNLYLGAVPGGGTPVLGADGLLAGGETFDIDAASVDASGNPVIHVGGATVSGNTVTGGPVDLALNIPVMGTAIALNIIDANVQVDVAADSLSNGVIGGELNIDQLVETVIAVGGDALPIDLVRSTLESVADLDVDAAGICQAVSISVVFDGVTAVKGATAAP